jgi:6-phosphogluconate dehydrogenase
MKKQQIGVIGLAVMGKNLAMNIESRGFGVSVYNRSGEKTDEVLAETDGKNIVGVYNLKDFVESLELPRKIIIMVKAGQPVDLTIDALLPLLSKGDIIIDGGNSCYKDTISRSRLLDEQGIRFIGMGVSGGEEGALHGPALMPGGSREAYSLVEPILTAISAKVSDDACCSYVGPDGAGHYVKMVHNGIEYADMQLISESYTLLRQLLGIQPDELSEIFFEWNQGELDSYLIEITKDILAAKDGETHQPLIDFILDAAGQKGTGKWTSQSALDLGVSTQTITEAVFARCMSAIKEERVAASKVLTGPKMTDFSEDKNEFIEHIRKALYASKICSYAQGFALLRAASMQYDWHIDFGAVSSIFRGGCIIRAQFLNKIKQAYSQNADLSNILLDPYFSAIILDYQTSLRKVAAAAVENGLAVPAHFSAIAYYDSYRSETLPANLLQAQRDYFGAHTFERIDKKRGEYFHHNWTGTGGSTCASTYNV